jgi:hypothetical protein
MAPRIKTLAERIRAHGFVVEVSESWSSTDRHISGTRCRHPGKGRFGKLLIVKDTHGQVVFRHDSSGTYRCNEEIVWWMKDNGIPL